MTLPSLYVRPYLLLLEAVDLEITLVPLCVSLPVSIRRYIISFIARQSVTKAASELSLLTETSRSILGSTSSNTDCFRLVSDRLSSALEQHCCSMNWLSADMASSTLMAITCSQVRRSLALRSAYVTLQSL